MTEGMRQKLPERRPSITDHVKFGSAVYTLTLGFDPSGRALELFCHGPKIGSDLEALLDDICVTGSRLLQHGDTLKDWAKSLGRESIDPNADAASLLGFIVQKAAEMEQEVGQFMGMQYHFSKRKRQTKEKTS